MTFRQQLERLLRFMLLAFILVAAGFISAVTAVRIAIRGRIVAMPNLVGLPAAQAAQTLSSKGLRLEVADRIFSSLPANEVVRQSPPAGERVKIPQDARVVLSLGPQMVMIPNLGGRSLRAARLTLLEAGLQLGEVSQVYMPDAPDDTVVAQEPPPSGAAPSPRIDLLVAEGEPPASYAMPAVVGLQQPDAEKILSAAGLKIAKVTDITQTDSPKGSVIGQKPPPGARIDGTATVELGIAD